MANLPTYIGKGTFTSGTGALSVPPPTGITNEDLLLLFVESANQAITTPAGWTEVPSSPQSTGTAAAAGGVRLAVFWKGVGGVEANASVADPGDHATGIMLAFRGVNLQDPFNVTTGSVKATASTAVSAPGVTTTVANTLIVHGIGLDKDLADTDTITTAWTNANLSGITERHDQSMASGVGGGIAVVTGNKLTAGATGNTTATSDTSTTLAYITLALQAPEPAVRTVGQYRNDRRTSVPVGEGTSGDGVSNEVFLQSEYDGGVRETPTTPKLEVKAVGTAFNGTPTSTAKTIKQTHSDVTSNRRGSTLVYDNVNKRLLAFGGYDGTTRYNDVWERYMDRPGQPWRKLSPTGTAPTGRNLHGSAIVTGNLTSGGAVRSYLLVWGGADPNDKNDMLALRIDTPGSEAWTTITQTSAPTARSYMGGQMVSTPGTDASNNYVYLYGGWAAARENALFRCTFDVDTPTAVTWTTLKANGAGGNPTQTTGAIMDYKASTGKLYLYGGYSGSTMLNTFWEYDIAGNTWTNTTPSGTAPISSETAAGGYDATNNRFWFTGGWTTNGTFSTGLNQIGYISNVGGSEAYNIVRTNTAMDANQTYAGHSFAGFTVIPELDFLYMKGMATIDSNERYDYIIDFNEGVTSNYPVYGVSEGEYFNARDAMASVWNPDANEWLNIGGFDDMYDDATVPSGTHSGDVWSYNTTTNSWRYAVKGHKGLPPLEGRIGDYDTTRDRVLLFGGLTGVTQVGNEVWELIRDEYGNYEANPLFPTGTRPSPRWLGACVYDEVNDRFIITLGGDGAGPTSANNVWALNFGPSDKHGTWTQLSPTGSVTATVGVGFTAKRSNKRLYIFGGASNSLMTTVLGNFYYLDYSTTNCAWNTVTQSSQTSRRTPAMAYDATNDRIVVMGGFNGTDTINTTSYYNLASGTTWANAATTVIPDARRSHIGEFLGDGKFYISGGRPNTGTWYRNTWQLTPNYTTPNSSTWVNKYPASFTPTYHVVTGLSASTSYHWQAWTTEGSIDSPKVSFGSNLESDTDFHTGYPSVPPTVVLNSPSDTAAVSDSTPTLEFTGTDPESNDIVYQVQLDTVNTFNSGGNIITDTYTATDTWVAPVGVTSVTVDMWGGGAASGSMLNSDTNGTAGGGGGGFSRKVVSVTPGNSYTVTVGDGGVGTAVGAPAIGPSGGDSWFSTSGTVLAKGGTGSSGITPGTGGQASAGIGDTKTSGGSGGAGYRSGGGGSGGSTGDGGTGGLPINSAGGAAGTGDPTGGQGGAGTGTGSFAGNAATERGGGGGGSGSGAGAGGRAGASGYRGEVRITYTTPLGLIEKTSDTDTGFVNTVNGGDTSPFTSGQKIGFTASSGLLDGTYYWRVRAKDPSGSNSYGAWSDIRSFILTASSGVTGYKKVYLGGSWTQKPVKVYSGGAWTQKPTKIHNGSSWVETVE